VSVGGVTTPLGLYNFIFMKEINLIFMATLKFN